MHEILADLAIIAVSCPHPAEVHINAADRYVDVLLATPADVRAWSAALHFGEPGIATDPGLGQVVTSTRVIVGGWNVTLRHIHTHPSSGVTA